MFPQINLNLFKFVSPNKFFLIEIKKYLKINYLINSRSEMLETINILKKKFINYAGEGMLNEMKEINDSIKLTNDTFNEALRFASIYGKLEVAKYLVSLGADDFNGALIKALEYGNLKVIKYLKECI